MNKDEKFIEDSFGKKQSFNVPKNYFDDFASQLMTKLPEKETNVIRLHTSHRKQLKWVALVAASVIFAVFFINIKSQDRPYSHSENQKNMAKVDNNNYSTLDEAADYSMIDNEDIYAYVSDN